jgi:pimeloyl-ACP methyl ester carboxylesterase
MTTLLIPGLLSDEHVWRRVLALHGEDAIVADITSADSITEMASRCLAAGEGPMIVAGHSMGARVALEMMRLALGRISRLALLNTGIHPPGPGEGEKRREMIRYGWQHGMAALATRWLPPMVHRQTKPVMSGLTDMVLRMDEAIHERQVTALAMRPDAISHLGDIDIPCLVMTGDNDRWSPVEQHRDITAAIPKARMEIIEGAGHFAPVECPKAVADVLVPFLKGQA